MRLLACLLAFACTSWGQPNAAVRPKPELERLADLALTLPPELAADALIELSSLPGPVDQHWRIERVDQAFDLASRARFPFDAASASDSLTTDSDAGIRLVALRHLSTLSLEARAATAMIALDRAKARQLFDRIHILQFPSLPCKAALVPNVHAYYRLIGRMVEQGYTAAEKQKGRHIDMIENQLMLMTSPVQLLPAARLLGEVTVASDALARLTTAYAAALKQISSDDRTFTSVPPRELTQALFDLASQCSKQNVSCFPLIETYRSYLVRHLRASRCSDSTDAEGEGAHVANTVEQFNISLRSSPPPLRTISPIRAEESKPSQVADEKAEIYEFWSKPSTQPLLARIKALRFGTPEQQAENNSKPRRPDGMLQFLTPAQRSEAGWESQVRDFLKVLDSGKNDSGESDADYFHQVCLTYIPVIELIPPGALRQSVIDSYIAYLRQSRMETENPPEWLLEFRRLLHLTDSTPQDKAQIADSVHRSGNAAMIVYTDLERLRPQ